MIENANATVTPVNQIQQTIAPVVDDLAKDVALGLKVVAANKTGGRAAVLALLPEAIEDVKATVADVQKALPTIKTGWKTSEFWLCAGTAIVFVGFEIAKHPLPDSLKITVASLVATYVGSRTVVKS